MVPINCEQPSKDSPGENVTRIVQSFAGKLDLGNFDDPIVLQNLDKEDKRHLVNIPNFLMIYARDVFYILIAVAFFFLMKNKK